MQWTGFKHYHKIFSSDAIWIKIVAEIRSSNHTSASNEASSPSQREVPSLSAGLYIVATPIGNLADLTTRALETLKSVDIVACEDTRVTAKLMNAYLIKKPLIPYHEHNGTTQRPKIIEKIQAGKSVALVSDAGTPLISDPGYKLVSEVAAAGLRVTTLPGPSALIAALTLAGLPTDRFIFLGFAPHKTKARCDWFDTEKNNTATLVYYESARRIKASLKDALSILGDRKATVCREISKKFEQVVRGSLQELVEHYEKHGDPKGEIVVVIAPHAKTSKPEVSETIETNQLLTIALKHMSVKSAAAFVAEATGTKKNIIYKQALALTNADEVGDNERE